MSDRDLETLIAELRAEIDRLGPDDHDAHARLATLVADLEHRVAKSGTDSADDEDEDLIERLRDTVDRFEIEHPRTTGIVNQIMVMLGNMGI